MSTEKKWRNLEQLLGFKWIPFSYVLLLMIVIHMMSHYHQQLHQHLSYWPHYSVQQWPPFGVFLRIDDSLFYLFTCITLSSLVLYPLNRTIDKNMASSYGSVKCFCFLLSFYPFTGFSIITESYSLWGLFFLFLEIPCDKSWWNCETYENDTAIIFMLFFLW